MYALDLRGVQIEGSVQLRPDVVAAGGVCLNLARVEGSVWCNGATLKGVEDSAFAADYATVKGSLYMRPYEHPEKPGDFGENDLSDPMYSLSTIGSQRLTAQGMISLFAAKIGGSLFLSGAELKLLPESKHTEDEGPIALEASNATFGGHCYFNCRHLASPPASPPNNVLRFKAEGVISLESTRINSDLTFSGAYVDTIKVPNLEVGGECRMSTWIPPAGPGQFAFRACTSVNLRGAVIKGTLMMSGAKIGSRAGSVSDWNSPDLALDMLEGSWDVASEARANNLPPETMGFFASNLKVGGKCEMNCKLPASGTAVDHAVSRFQCFGQIVLREAILQNSLRMEGAEIVGPQERPGVDLAGATIGGQATFGVASNKDPRKRFSFRLLGGRTGLRLSGMKAGEKVRLNGAKLYSTHIALDGANVEIGGSATFERFEGEHFEAHGLVRLSSSSIKLGLRISYARLLPSLEGTETNFSKSLDLSLAKVKVIEFSGSEEQPFTAFGEVCLRGAEIEADCLVQNSCFRETLSLEYVRIGSSLSFKEVRLMPFSTKGRESTEQHLKRAEKVSLAMQGAQVRGELRVGGIRLLDKSTKSVIVIDLRGAHLEQLNDDCGRGWRRDVRLWLEGFSYARLAEVAPETATLRLRKLWHRSYNPSWLPEEADDTTRESTWEKRLRWLRLQYVVAGRPQKSEFQPGPYEQVVSSWNSTGAYDDARRINSAKLTDGLVDRKWPGSWLSLLFRVFFDYGLSAKRAIFTFIFCIGIGWMGADIANGTSDFWRLSKPALVATLGHPETFVFEKGQERAVVHHLAANESALSSEELPCGGRVMPLLYAFDVFVPVLDLRQQSVCTISPERRGWRIAQTVYAVMGWVLTPLMFLSVTGILRRHIEK